MQYEVWLNDDATATSSARVEYTNNNPVTPQPPKYYGGGYNNFLRLIRDQLWTLIDVQRDGQSLDMKNIVGEVDTISHATSSGMLADVGGGESHAFTYRYMHEKRFDYAKAQEYILKIQKQPGLHTNEYEVVVHVPQKTMIKNVDTSFAYELTEYQLHMHTLVDRDLTLSFTVSSMIYIAGYLCLHGSFSLENTYYSCYSWRVLHYSMQLAKLRRRKTYV